MNYRYNDLISIAARDGNKTRNYVLVNRLQAKHIPVSPLEAIRFMKEFGNSDVNFCGSRTSVIAIAETATALGMSVAHAIGKDCRCIQTTREECGQYVAFSEEHSHATAQKLNAQGLELVLKNCNTVIIVDDETTTGKTALNLVRAIEKHFPFAEDIYFCLYSVINRMKEEDFARFYKEGVSAVGMIGADSNDYSRIAAEIGINGAKKNFRGSKGSFRLIDAVGKKDFRKGTTAGDYIAACDALYAEIKKSVQASVRKLLILGTEEIMYPAVYAGARLEEEMGIEVLCHSTTRSPIDPSDEACCKLRSRCAIDSFYEEDRNTYIYNLAAYDYTVVITDSESSCAETGAASLAAALQDAGCSAITVFRWVQ